MRKLKLALPALALLAGCASYTWRPSVPEGSRTVSVPVFRNETDVSALGSAVARQTLREFQREGTYSVADSNDCALEVQGVLTSASSGTVAYERRTGARNRERRFKAVATVSFVDKAGGRTLLERKYKAETTFLVNDDVVTGERDASGRLAEDLARQIVDDALALDWKGGE